MAVAWPATLPAPIANSVKLHTQKNTRTIEFSAKNRRTTTRASKPPSIVECDISMDSVQLDAFDYFIKFDLSYGAHWIDASWMLALGFSAHFARFLELPKINKRGGRFTVSCVFEIVLRSVAVQMPNTVFYPTSNIQPMAMTTDGLLGWFKADEIALGTLYKPAPGQSAIIPNAMGPDTLRIIYPDQLKVDTFNNMPALMYSGHNDVLLESMSTEVPYSLKTHIYVIDTSSYGFFGLTNLTYGPMYQELHWEGTNGNYSNNTTAARQVITVRAPTYERYGAVNVRRNGTVIYTPVNNRYVSYGVAGQKTLSVRMIIPFAMNEFSYFDRWLTDDEVTQWENYLIQKWLIV